MIMEVDVENKMHKAFPLPVIEFPLAEEVPTASEEGCHCQKKRDANARKIALLSKSKRNCQSKMAITLNTTSGETDKKSGRTVTLTTEDMQKKKNDVKARTTLLLSLPDEHQLRFSKYKTAQELLAAILKTFGGNEATKKTKKNLLKQQYRNFKAKGSETLEQTFNRLQVIVGQLQFMDVEIKQDDLNQKFLTSLAPEWRMHTIVWRNRSDFDTMSLDDLYNHLKVYESEVQKTLEPNSQNMAFISSAKHSSGNKDGNIACVPTVSTNVLTASASVATINQDTACAYIASQSSGFDKSKVECFNCHKMGHFARECRAPRSQDRGRRDNYRQGSKVKEQAPKALMTINGVGWDWSYMANDGEDHALVADEEAPTEFALMANTSTESKVFDNSLCSKDCKKNNDSLNSKITDLTDKLFDANNMIYHYKLALAQVKSRLVEYKEREVKYCEKIRTLEFYNESNNECIEILKKKLVTLKQEKEGVDGKLAGLLTASKYLDNLIESQRTDKNKEGLGYSVVPPPPAQIYSSPKKDLNYSVSETVASPITPKPFVKFVKASDSPTESKIDKAEKAKKSSVKYAEQYRKTNKKPNVRGNQKNWNNLKSHQFGPDFVMKKKACFNCGNFNHLTYDYRKRVKRGTTRSQNNTYKSPTHRPVVHRPHGPPMRPMRSNMNGVCQNRTSFNKPAHSYTNRPVQRKSAVKSQYRAPWVPTVNKNFPYVNRKFSTSSRNFPTANRKFPTASRKFPTGSTKFSTADMGMKGKAGSSQNNIDDKGYWDSGCSRHMTGNLPYFSDYEPFDEGYVSFGQGGCKITGKGTIKTGKLEFEYVYFVKDLKYNLFSVSQICDNKNSVMFTDSECIVLGRDFKLLDDANVLLRTPRQHNMHNLVRGLPTKCFENNHNCTTRLKGKQHKASCKSKLVNSVSKPLHTLHMELFGPTSDETSGILKKFITKIENLKDLKVKIIRVLVNKSHNKTPYELFNGKTPAIGFLKPFGCHVMILNTLDNLGKFEANGDEGYFIGYSMSSKEFRVFNKRTKRVEENLHIEFLENKAIEKGAGPNWLFDIDSLTKSMNYVPVVDAGTTSTNFSVTKDAADDCNTDVPESSGNSNPTATSTIPLADQVETLTVESPIPTASSPVPTAYFTDSQEPSSETRLISKRVANQVETPSLDNILTLMNRFEDILGVTTNSDESNGVEAEVSNLETTITASPTPTLRIHKDHPKSQIIGPMDTPIQTRNKSKEVGEQKPKKISDALQDPSWVEAMQEELLQFKIQKDERGIVIKNKARLVAQGHTQEEGIDYDEVFAPIARIEAIRLFLAYASFMSFKVYQMDVKSAFLYGTIDKEVYVMQPPGFQDSEYPAKVYKVEKAMYGLHQAPRAWYGTLSKYLLKNGFQKGTIDQTLFIRRQRGDFILVQVYMDDIIFGSSNPQLCREFEVLMHEKFQMSTIGELNFFLGLQVLQKKDDIFLSQDKYVGDILKKFGYSDVRSSNTPIDKENP
nr:hypothetical protein [Tanacetum cinerariifolium]